LRAGCSGRPRGRRAGRRGPRPVGAGSLVERLAQGVRRLLQVAHGRLDPLEVADLAASRVRSIAFCTPSLSASRSLPSCSLSNFFICHTWNLLGYGPPPASAPLVLLGVDVGLLAHLSISFPTAADCSIRTVCSLPVPISRAETLRMPWRRCRISPRSAARRAGPAKAFEVELAQEPVLGAMGRFRLETFTVTAVWCRRPSETLLALGGMVVFRSPGRHNALPGSRCPDSAGSRPATARRGPRRPARRLDRRPTATTSSGLTPCRLLVEHLAHQLLDFRMRVDRPRGLLRRYRSH